jgi:hypothetical protein
MANLTCPGSSFPVDTTWRSTTNSHGIPLGTRAYASGGREYVFVKASGVIGAKHAISMGLSATGLDAVVTSTDLEVPIAGAADGTAFADGEYGFMLTRGYTTVLCTDSITAGIAVASSATDGLLIAQTAAHYGGRAGRVLVTAANADTDGAVVWLEGI